MHLDQIQLSYLLDEDRILLKIGFNTADYEKRQEIRIFITRRLLQQLWPMLMQTMATQVTLDRPEAAFASQDIVHMEHQASLSSMADRGGFAQEYAEHARELPFGETPLLLDSIKFHVNAHQPLHIQLFPMKRGCVDLHLESTMLHGICKLLQDMEREAGWGLELILPGTGLASVAGSLLN